jgi:anti-sigma factor RsiW
MKQPDDMTVVPDLLLERYILDELPPGEMLVLERRLAEDVSLQRRLAALEDANREIRSAYPPAWLAGRIRARMAEAGFASKRDPFRRRMREHVCSGGQSRRGWRLPCWRSSS